MKPVIVSALLALLLLLQLNSAEDTVEILANPSPGSNESTVYISAAVDQNITIECSVRVNSGMVQTAWRDEAQQTNIIFDFESGTPTTAGYSFLSASPSPHRELTIHGFESDLDRLMLACYGSNIDPLIDRVIFFFGIPIITLRDANEEYNVTESHDFFLDLADNNRTSFPPQVEGLWLINGQEILTSSQITTTAYSFMIENINRSYSESVVNLTVSNTAGRRTTQFTLNVVYQPELEKGDPMVFAILGDPVNITAATSVGGNPSPATSWIGPTGSSEINLEGRFSQPTVGTLQIESLQQNDFGDYKFIAANGVGSNADFTVSLIQLIEPSQPRNLSSTLPSTGMVVLEWDPPDLPGVPPYTGYIVIIVSDGNRDNPITRTTNTTSLTLENLNPGMTYNVTVSAVSSVFSNGGKQSLISFTTETTGPIIGSLTRLSKNGGIDVQWSLESTGGISPKKVTVDITCEILTNSNSRISYNCMKDCIDLNLNGSRLVGPAHAGFMYRCVVTISNGVEFQAESIPLIYTKTGIPSKPSVEVDSKNMNIILKARYPGVELISAFAFTVKIFDEDNGLVPSYPSSYNGTNDTSVSIMVTETGTYTIEVMSVNPYGSSDKTSVTFEKEQATVPSTYPNTTSQNELNLAVVASAGGAGAAVGLIVVIVLVVLIAYIVCKRTRYRSTTFTSNGKLPADNRKQFDRPRIPSVGSTVLY